MNVYEFHLVLALPHMSEEESEKIVFQLHDSSIIGDQISVGFGRKGRLAIDVFFESKSAKNAVDATLSEIERIIPRACVAEIGPDLLNLSGLSEIFGCSRQNMRKYAADEHSNTRQPFPLPAVTTNGTLMWHLFQVADWVNRNTKIEVANELIEIAQATARMNAQITERALDGDRYKSSLAVEARRYVWVTPSTSVMQSIRTEPIISSEDFMDSTKTIHLKN